MNISRKLFIEKAVAERKQKVYSYINSLDDFKKLKNRHVLDGTVHALGFGGKSLRPALLLFSCGAVSGDEDRALPAAAAVEIYHTWTLVHDDIIDRDLKRRGHETIHEEFRRRAVEELGYGDAQAAHYGTTMGILIGDILQGWSLARLCELTQRSNIRPEIPLHLLYDLATRVQGTLVEGETLDVQFGQMSVDAVTEEDILDMLSKKTGALYEYAAKAGAMIGSNNPDPKMTTTLALSSFASKCGLAFQIHDDILGIIADEKILGKPVGSDIREGKKTLIIRHAMSQASQSQKNYLLSVLGNVYCSEEETHKATKILIDLGGIDYAAGIARYYLELGIQELQELSLYHPYKDLLIDWAEYLIMRDS